MSEQTCGNCQHAKPSDLIGWKKCTFPLPTKPLLPYWAIHNDMWATPDMPADVEVDDENCAVWQGLTPCQEEEG